MGQGGVRKWVGGRRSVRWERGLASALVTQVATGHVMGCKPRNRTV